jgi:flagellin FlaB
MHNIQWLKRKLADQRGITGLETAIILIAFVVVASVFAYTVLSAGVFSSEKGKEAIHAGIEQARGTMEIVGGIVLKDTGVPTGSVAQDDTVDQVIFTVANALDGEALDLTTTVDSDNDGTLSDETGRTHTAIISYIDKNQRVDDIAWTRTQVGKGDSDALLEAGEPEADFLAVEAAIQGEAFGRLYGVDRFCVADHCCGHGLYHDFRPWHHVRRRLGCDHGHGLLLGRLDHLQSGSIRDQNDSGLRRG